jgi:hypothetical protein
MRDAGASVDGGVATSDGTILSSKPGSGMVGGDGCPHTSMTVMAQAMQHAVAVHLDATPILNLAREPKERLEIVRLLNGHHLDCWGVITCILTWFNRHTCWLRMLAFLARLARLAKGWKRCSTRPWDAAPMAKILKTRFRARSVRHDG